MELKLRMEEFFPPHPYPLLSLTHKDTFHIFAVASDTNTTSFQGRKNGYNVFCSRTLLGPHIRVESTT